MHVSAVILTWNSAAHIAACLDSVLAALDEAGGQNEIFVVDNGSSDTTPAILKTYAGTGDAAVHISLLDANRGTTKTRNMALRRATGDFVLIIDADAVIQPGTLRPMIDHLNASPGTGLIAPSLVFPDGRPQLSTDQFPTVGHKIKRVLFLRSMERQIAPAAQPATPHTVDYAISACWLLPRRTLDTVGVFDERFFYAPEDVDYCLSVWLAGHSVEVMPAVVAIHEATEHSRNILPNRLLLHHFVGLLKYFIKRRYCFSLRRIYDRIDRAAPAHRLTAKPASTPGT